MIKKITPSYSGQGLISWPSYIYCMYLLAYVWHRKWFSCRFMTMDMLCIGNVNTIIL